jgi:RNA polymerase sigma-70 factor (ECF subfamily)
MAKDARKFEEEWRKVEDNFHVYLYKSGFPREDIEDMLQKTAMKAWRNYNTLCGEFGPWAYKILYHVKVDQIRSKKKTNKIVPIDDLIAEIADGKQNPHRYAETHLMVMQFMSELTQMERDVMYLREVEGQTFKKVGEELGVSESNADYHHKKAVRKLRESYPELVLHFKDQNK